MDIRTLFHHVSDAMRNVNFDKIWKGFSRCEFALYDDNTVYLKGETVPRDNRFLGNTAIAYNGETIAIWEIHDPSNEDIALLAANLVHEMFHAMQKTGGERRFPNDLLMLDYPDSLENYTLKWQENEYLCEAVLSNDDNRRLFYLEKFIAVRKRRRAIIGDIMTQELYTETVEGLAEYVGCMALRQLSTDKYYVKLHAYLNRLRAEDAGFFDLRRNLYYSGALFCVALSDAKIDFCHAFENETLSLFELISQSIHVKPVNPVSPSETFQSLYHKYLAEKKQTFDRFLGAHRIKKTVRCFICGYDPMNMTKQGNMILCTRFVMLNNSGMASPLFVKGPVILILKEGTIDEVTAYIT